MSAQDWIISTLSKAHDRTQFDCGERTLNEFIRNYARQNQKENVGRTWVATAPDERRILGFHTLTVASVERELFASEDAKRLPRYPVPVAHLGRLAVDRTAQGAGLGSHLLLHALEQVLRVSKVIGIYAVEVRAKESKAKQFYEHFGFRRMLDDEHHLYLSVRVLPKLFDP